MPLPKAYRLKSRGDFQAVFREGVRCHSSHFTLRALKPLSPTHLHSSSINIPANTCENLPNTKIGISISTKVSKRAVVRNRIKRQITGVLYQLLPKLSKGWRLVVIVKPKTGEWECISQQFLRELEQLLVKAEVINGHS
ncbi:ribonuclease P protein component [Cylindrospermopsis raciborskii S07]|uniref:Ribonuclease P protein component n=2 Tax=Cylindrospermopsis raciborskii TaxID=77022 RepID=A0A853MH65_9CYAN|nr:ribonuclease P protein component [Cylindrospermopsis raciborskii]MBU6346092.1 ribonuclease P protein component [Cyanobacteria bacterium REEB494]EFA68701.1 ribonuclease P protein [Cylindrospermopsis raciborskii CS-505]OBU76616.1 ribonuclease P protein component [Cylindrospermopsis raciborskii CS-505]OHY32572.1 ribonuclease P protein component [Cylindrospermopsis raciborskii CS-508]PNJ95445.1 ribonuclease P protein component [Cylindrospermopsis raciborskii C03]